MTDQALHGPHAAVRVRGVADDGAQSVGLGRVPESRAHRLSLHVRDVAGFDVGCTERGLKLGLLSGSTRGEIALASTTARQRRRQNAAEHAVPITQSVRQRAQQQRPHPLGGDHAVSGLRERLRPTTLGQHAALDQPEVVTGVKDQIDSSGHRHAALTPSQTLTRQVDGRRRGGAGRVHGDARAVEAEGEGRAVGDIPQAGAGERTASPAPFLRREHLVGIVHSTDEHPDTD